MSRKIKEFVKKEVIFGIHRLAHFRNIVESYDNNGGAKAKWFL